MREDQRRVLAAALMKVLGLAVGVGALLAVAVFLMVKALGFSDSTPAAHTTTEESGSPSALPTRALTPSGSPSATSSPVTTHRASPSPRHRIHLSASPAKVGAGQRINLTGSYPGQDNVTLQVQRKENGRWVPFADVQATVHVSTFTTYVLTSHTGPNVFRMLDPGGRATSNPVTVAVG